MNSFRAYARLSKSLFIMSFVLALAGCGGSVVVSDYVSLKLSGIKDGDVKNGQVSEDKNINTEEGNPYADFLRLASEELGGDTPSKIEVQSVTLKVHSDSKGISDFDALFLNMEVFVSSNDTIANLGVFESIVGSVLNLKNIDNDSLAPLQSALISGDFKMGIRGDVSDSLPDDFDLKISMDVQFSAYP